MTSSDLKRQALRKRDAGQRASREHNFEAAIAAFELDRSNLLACRRLAHIHTAAGRHADAADVYGQLDSTTERDFSFWLEYGESLRLARRHHEAIDAFLQALERQVDSAIVHYRLGMVFHELGMSGESAECFRTVVAIDRGPIRTAALFALVYDSRVACDWTRLEEETNALLAALETIDEANCSSLSPFTLIALETTAQQQRRIGEFCSRAITRNIQPLPPPAIGARRRPGRIRVGYLSADFCHHATSQLMIELLESRDQGRFETFLYSHSADDGSVLQKRLQAACEHFIDVKHLSNAAVAQRMRDDALDIVIDLKGYTRDSRFELLAYRPAAVQVAWLGYPGSTGADFIDYLIGDPIVLPIEHAANYSEKIAQLPVTYQPNERKRLLPAATPRGELGLPEEAVVLCCFNQTYKMSPQMLDIWATILRAAPNTVLWILAWERHVVGNLHREFAKRGITADRVIFAPKVEPAQHLARLRAADLFLDTWPCNAHTTASDALFAGVPVLTLPGETFASRVAASLVNACGLPDLICQDSEAYTNLAIGLANELELLRALKNHLEESRADLPLFDSARFTREFEALLLRMHSHAQAGLSPIEMLVEHAV